MAYTVSYACFSGKGKRDVNQDNYFCCGAYEPEAHGDGIVPGGTADAAHRPLFFVFDGMGGESQGETASFLAAETMARSAEARRAETNADLYLQGICMDMNDSLTAAADAAGVQTVGSTAAGVLFEPERVTVCNLGDSRVYRLRDGALTLCSRDHTVLLPEGRSTDLVQFLGVRESDFSISPHLAHAAPKEGDMYLICSDGLTDALDAGRIGAVLQKNPTAFSAAALLCHEALYDWGEDNVTVMVCRIERG